MAEEVEPIVATRLESPGAVEDMSSSSARTAAGASAQLTATPAVSSSARPTSTAVVTTPKSSVAPPVAASSSSSSAIPKSSSTLSSTTSSSSSSRASSALSSTTSSSTSSTSSPSSTTSSSTTSSTSSATSSKSTSPKVVTVTTSVSSSVSRSSSASASTSSSTLVGGNEGSASKESSGLSTGAIVGIAIGGVAVLCIIALLATRSFRKRARTKRTANRTSIMDWNPPVHHEEKDETPYTPPLQSYAMQPPYSQDLGYQPQPPLADTFQQQQYQQVYHPEPAYTAAYPGAMPVAPVVPPSAPKPAHGLTDGTMVRVKQAFVRSLDDELAITPDQQLLMHTAYDDGWCLCEDGTNNKGMVPISCLEPWAEPQHQSGMIRSDTDTSLSSRSQRRSSLHADRHAAGPHFNAQQ